MKFKLLIFTLLIGGLFVMNGCGDDNFSCEDGKQNQGETGIDCGGPCPNCEYMRTCSDGIQNGEELGVDCGGPCPAACTNQPPVEPQPNPIFTATVNGTEWSAVQVSSGVLNQTLTFAGLDSNGQDEDFNISITYSEEFTTRTGDFDMITNTAFITGTGITNECVAQTGSVTFTKFDLTNNLVSGTFEFTCQDADGNDVSVTSGSFQDIPL